LDRGRPLLLSSPARRSSDLGRAALRTRGSTHAYLVLLRIEVAAFHPAMPPPMTDGAARRWPCRCAPGAPAPQTRLCGPVPRPRRRDKPRGAAGRPLAAILPCGVRTFLDGFAPAAIARPVLPAHFSTAGGR